VEPIDFESHFYLPDGRLQSPIFNVLKALHPGRTLRRDMSWQELMELLEPFIKANKKKPGTDQPAQRWHGVNHPVFSQVDPDKLADLFEAAGYVKGVIQLCGITHFDLVIVPGGKAWPQWRKFSLLFSLISSGVIEVDQLVFQRGRKLDSDTESLSDFEYVSRDGLLVPPTGCLQYRPGYVLPTSLNEDDFEHQIGEHFWANLPRPDQLVNHEPIFTTRPTDIIAERQARLNKQNLDVLLVTVVPHWFHWPMYTRLAKGCNVAMVAPGAQIGRHDNPYLADGLGRHAKATFELGRDRALEKFGA
jgi:hypothetical protein